MRTTIVIDTPKQPVVEGTAALIAPEAVRLQRQQLHGAYTYLVSATEEESDIDDVATEAEAEAQNQAAAAAQAAAVGTVAVSQDAARLQPAVFPADHVDKALDGPLPADITAKLQPANVDAVVSNPLASAQQAAAAVEAPPEKRNLIERVLGIGETAAPAVETPVEPAPVADAAPAAPSAPAV